MKALYIPTHLISAFVSSKDYKFYARLGHMDYTTRKAVYMKRKFPVYMGDLSQNGYGCMIVIDPYDKENPIPFYFNIIHIELYVSKEKRKTMDQPDAAYLISTAIITEEADKEFHVMDRDKDECYGIMDMIFPLHHHVLHIDGALRRNYNHMAVYQTTGYGNNVLFEEKKRDDSE